MHFQRQNGFWLTVQVFLTFFFVVVRKKDKIIRFDFFGCCRCRCCAMPFLRWRTVDSNNAVVRLPDSRIDLDCEARPTMRTRLYNPFEKLGTNQPTMAVFLSLCELSFAELPANWQQRRGASSSSSNEHRASTAMMVEQARKQQRKKWNESVKWSCRNHFTNENGVIFSSRNNIFFRWSWIDEPKNLPSAIIYQLQIYIFRTFVARGMKRPRGKSSRSNRWQ